MIDVDIVTALEFLRMHGIDTARTKCVDSAEDAIAFAERRDAPDPRFMPTVLRIGSPLSPDAVLPQASTSIDAVRARYEHLAPAASAASLCVLAQEIPSKGTDLRISGGLENGRRAMWIGEGANRAVRFMPLDDSGADALAEHARRFGHRERPHVERMLAHVVRKIASFFEENDIDAFRFALREHENAYVVYDAAMKVSKALHFKKRLGAHAHDRKAMEFHPSGPQ